MNPTIEQLYQDIGAVAREVADDLAGKLLVYAEVEDGVISADIFYVNLAGVLRFRRAAGRPGLVGIVRTPASTADPITRIIPAHDLVRLHS